MLARELELNCKMTQRSARWSISLDFQSNPWLVIASFYSMPMSMKIHESTKVRCCLEVDLVTSTKLCPGASGKPFVGPTATFGARGLTGATSARKLDIGEAMLSSLVKFCVGLGVACHHCPLGARHQHQIVPRRVGKIRRRPHRYLWSPRVDRHPGAVPPQEPRIRRRHRPPAQPGPPPPNLLGNLGQQARPQHRSAARSGCWSGHRSSGGTMRQNSPGLSRSGK